MGLCYTQVVDKSSTVMDSWYLWDDFLKIVAVDHQLSSTETKAFLSSFLRDNLNKNDQERANLYTGRQKPQNKVIKNRWAEFIKN